MNSEATTAPSESRKILPPRGASLITSLRYIGLTIIFYIKLLFNTIFSLIGGGKEKYNGEIPISMPSSSDRDEIIPDNFNSSTPNSDVKDVRRNSIPDSQAPSSLTNTLKEEPNGRHTVLVLDETKALAEAVANDALSEMLASSSNSELPEPGMDETKNTLVIKNLPFKFKQTDLDVLLNTHSAKPKNVRLMRDSAGRFTGIAFIRCPSKEEAGRLIQSMNNLDIGGRNIQVEFKKKKTKKKLGESSDSDFSNCSSLRSSAEYLNYNPEEANEPPREFLGARRMSLRTSAEYAREVIGREHLQTNILPIPNDPLPRSNLAPAPQNLQRRRPSFTPQTTTGMEAAFSQSYFQQQPFSIPQQQARTPPRKPDSLRKSTEEIPALYTFVPPNTGSGMMGFPPERRRSIATPEELSGFRNQAPRTGYIRPFTLTSAANQGPTIQPIRQPYGPDGKTNGFSAEYRKSRTVC